MPDPCLSSSPRIALSLTGSPPALTADIIIDPDPINGAENRIDGLWAPGRPAFVTGVLPSSPEDGEEVFYLADSDNGIVWHLRYRAGSASPYKWEYVGGGSFFSEVLTSETRAAGGSAYANMATVGPQVTCPLAGDYTVRHGATMAAGTPGTAAKQSIKLGATAAGDTQAARVNEDNLISGAREFIASGMVAGAVLLAQYANSDGAAAATFLHRWLEVLPKRVI